MSEYVKHEIMLPKELSEKIPSGSSLWWKRPKKSDLHVSRYTDICVMSISDYCYNAITIEEPWTAPDWMPKGWWLAMDADLTWYLYQHEPEWNGEYWSVDGNWSSIPDWLNWTPPTVDGAKDSLRQI